MLERKPFVVVVVIPLSSLALRPPFAAIALGRLGSSAAARRSTAIVGTLSIQLDAVGSGDGPKSITRTLAPGLAFLAPGRVLVLDKIIRTDSVSRGYSCCRSLSCGRSLKNELSHVSKGYVDNGQNIAVE